MGIILGSASQGYCEDSVSYCTKPSKYLALACPSLDSVYFIAIVCCVLNTCLAWLPPLSSSLSLLPPSLSLSLDVLYITAQVIHVHSRKTWIYIQKGKVKDHSDSTTKNSNCFARILLVFVYVNSLHLCKYKCSCACRYITTYIGSYCNSV